MNFPFFIAKRYLFSSTTKTAVNIISFVSMTGVIVGTAALVLLLSVFNGFEDLLLIMYNSFDPHIKITSKEGKTFDPESIFSELDNNEDILSLVLFFRGHLQTFSQMIVSIDLRQYFRLSCHSIQIQKVNSRINIYVVSGIRYRSLFGSLKLFFLLHFS